MKKYLLLVAFLNGVVLMGQHKMADNIKELQRVNTNFKTISILLPLQKVQDIQVDEVVENATLATLNLVSLNEVLKYKNEYIELEIPYQNQIISVLLYSVNPFKEGFHVDTDKAKSIPYQKGVYYRGIIKGQPKSVAAFNFFESECNGVLSSPNLGNLVIGKLDKPNNQTDYVIYSDAKMKVLNNFDCHTKEDVSHFPKTGNQDKNVATARCVAFYFEVDNTLYTQNGNNETTTTNWITSVFNNVQTLYNNDGISVGLKSIFIWTVPDPYETATMTAIGHLNAFAANTTVFDGDAGMLVSIDPHPLGSAGLGGVAFLNSLCLSNNYAYTDVNLAYNSVPTFSWTVQAITHEFGHSLGSSHTHACVWNGNNTAIDNCAPYVYGVGTEGYSCMTTPPTLPTSSEGGTLMSYCTSVPGIGINFANGFGPQPKALLIANVDSKTCLSTDCITTCISTVYNIAANVTSTSATITWSDLNSSGASYYISVTPFASSTPIWNTVTTNSYSVSNLNPNEYYRIQIKPICATIVPVLKEKIFATVGDYCSDMVFTDTGGISGNYIDRESWTRTMTPYNSGLKLKIMFSSFDLEPNYDYLYIYNGPDTTYPNLTPGGLTGAISAGEYNSTATDGSLTFKFYSDEGTVASGWNATISCTGTLGQENNDYLDYRYYPNPTTGKVTISSKDAITEIAVYNIAGQLLFNQKLNELNTNVDMTPFASGTYFFRLKFNDKEANFKILKM